MKLFWFESKRVDGSVFPYPSKEEIGTEELKRLCAVISNGMDQDEDCNVFICGSEPLSDDEISEMKAFIEAGANSVRYQLDKIVIKNFDDYTVNLFLVFGGVLVSKKIVDDKKAARKSVESLESIGSLQFIDVTGQGLTQAQQGFYNAETAADVETSEEESDTSSEDEN